MQVLRFDEFMDLALYDPERGFFTSSAATAGANDRPHGDFITSPEVGPLFGTLVARYLDHRWVGAGRPRRFDVIEWAAGRGALAIAVRAAEPECLVAGALRYHMVEISGPLRSAQLEHLPVGEGTFIAHEDGSTLPADVDVVLANELLDNLPFRIFERVDGGSAWAEVMVAEPDGAAGWSELVAEPVDDELVVGVLNSTAGDAPAGAQVPLQQRAALWLSDALWRVDARRGAVVAIDYARTTAEMAAAGRSGWLRTYRAHQRAGSPLDAPGSADITADVAVDQLASVRRPTQQVTQAEWLGGLGIDQLVAEGREIWAANAAAPDLAAMKARSRISEAEALCDPDGLGGFTVLVWES